MDKNHMKNSVVAVLKGLKRDRRCESDWFSGSERHSAKQVSVRIGQKKDQRLRLVTHVTKSSVLADPAFATMNHITQQTTELHTKMQPRADVRIELNSVLSPPEPIKKKKTHSVPDVVRGRMESANHSPPVNETCCGNVSCWFYIVLQQMENQEFFG